MPEAVTPQARLCLEVQLLRQRVVQVSFFAVHKGRHPHAGLQIRAPTVEVEIPAGSPAAAVGAVKTHDVEILIFNPDAPEEAALAGLLHGRDVEHQAAHFADEFSAYVIKLVMLLVKAVRVDEDHLQEAVRQELHRKRKEVADRPENLFPLAIRVRQRDERDTL